MRKTDRKCRWFTALLAMAASLHLGAAETDVEFFEKRIRPVLVESCHECHSAGSKKLRGGLKLDTREDLLKGGETGPGLVPGNPEKSLVYRAMAHLEKEMEMPPKKPKLGSQILADFEKWIRSGAPWPGGNSSQVAASPAAGSEFDMAGRKAQLAWIWEPPRRHPLPKVRDADWPAGPIDRFILGRLEQEGLKPSPAAEPNVWLRRVTFTLVGLPPTVDQLRAFVADPSPAGRERIVDELLASPRFGERWGRHWLDLVRYAESRGHESDYIIPNAYEYRDYVIRAVNQDVPYDRFITEHIAGDLLGQPRRNIQSGFNESLLGTGWAFLGEEIHAPVDTRLDETERMDNRIDVFSKTFLGLTVSCARCHDHKFDAISQKDYYALAGFFISTGQRLARFESIEAEKETSAQLAVVRQRQQPELTRELAESKMPVLSRLKPYLQSAVEAMRVEPLAGRGKALQQQDLHSSTKGTIQRLAEQRGLDAGILSEWTISLCNAITNKTDALHPLSQVALGRPLPKEAKAVWQPELPADARTILDFSRLQEGDWLTDGFAFGNGPAKPGTILLSGGTTNNPGGIHLVTRAAATFDPQWKKAGLRSGVETEPTLYGKWKRDGATLRTPKFELKTGKLHYLVRGSGRVVAAVDSQRLITGPVHTGLVREWSGRENWFWFTHDLSDYIGHRVSVEFSPGNDQDTSIAWIVESATVPPSPASPGEHLAAALEAKGAGAVLESALAVYEDALSGAVRALKQGQVDGASCEIAGWLCNRPELFSGRKAAWPERMVKAIEKGIHEIEPMTRAVAWSARTAPAMMEGNGVDEFLLVRGKHHNPKGMVPRRFLEAVSGPAPLSTGGGSGRLELAQTLTSPTNPLVARVFVNRVWHHVFGRGIVPTVDNFGWLGMRPTHPELLDYLADSFINQDRWSLKALVRRMVLSSTYAQSSKPHDSMTEEKDPENALLHRMNLKRLEAESIRDAILSVSGRLDEQMYGPSVPLHPSQFMEARGLRSERGPLDGNGRRSIYVAARRNFLPMMMMAFDLPIPFTTVGRRNVSNVPGQMLFLMNDPFVHEQASVWSRALRTNPVATTDEERIRLMYLQAFSREPGRGEIERCAASLREAAQIAGGKAGEVDAWAELCHALIGVKEFIFIR